MEIKHVPVLGSIAAKMSDADMDYGPMLAGIGFILIVTAFAAFGITIGGVFSFVLILMPIWLPAILFLIFFHKWTDMVGLSFYLGNGRSTLRIIPPQEVTKSPEAMEFVIAQIHNTANPDNLMQTYLDGKRPLPYSFEVVSIGGEVRLYVNVPTKKTRNAIETLLYSQYPGIEIREEPVDYAAEIPLDTEKDTIMAFHMGKKKEGFMPVKTYIDYGLDKWPKEEEKIEPMTPMLDILASIKPHERLYIQFICTSFRKESFKMGQLRRGEGPNWNKETEDYINKKMERAGSVSEDEEEGGFMPKLTPSERKLIETLERHSGKYAYSVGIRWLYINREGGFNGDLINPTIRSFSQWDGANQIGVRWRTDFNYKDIIPGGKKKELAALKKQELKFYKLRKYVQRGQGDAPKIFTAEELASIFHVPGQVVTTPTLARVQSTRSEAPTNLPIGTPNNDQ